MTSTIRRFLPDDKEDEHAHAHAHALALAHAHANTRRAVYIYTDIASTYKVIQ